MKYTVIITTNVAQENLGNSIEMVNNNINKTGFMTGKIEIGNKYVKYTTLSEPEQQ